MAQKFYQRIDWNGGGVTHVFKLFLWTIAFGWFGNCTPRTLQFQRTGRVLEIAYVHKNLRDTVLWFNLGRHRYDENGRRLTYRFAWNSEWIAGRWGKSLEDEGPCPRHPDAVIYDGWLGYHLWV